MARRRRQDDAEDPARKTSPVGQWLGALLIVALFAGIAVAVTMAVISFVDDDESVEPLPDFIAEAPPIERSAAADLLAGKSFDEMTQEELDLVARETKRVFDDAEFRASSQYIAGIDVVRRDGVTRATRQFGYGDKPDGGGTILTAATWFYCDSEVEGFLDVFKVYQSVLATHTEGDRIVATSQAFDREMTGVDWSTPIDLGFDEVDGRRVHGVELPFTTLSGASSRWQMWIDVENARMLRRVERNADDVAVHDYHLDWRVPPRIEPAGGLDPPCDDGLYAQN